MKIHTHNKSSLFLLEIILNFLFFMLSAIICLQMYLKSHQISSTSAQLEQAVTICSSVAQICQSSTDPTATLTELYPDAASSNSLVVLYLDYEFHSCQKGSSCAYIVKAAILDSPDDQIQISCYQNGSDVPVYTVLASAFQPRTLNDITGGISQ